MLTIVTRTTPKCVYCVAAKSYLDGKSLDYKEVELESVAEVIKALGIRTIPAVFNGPISKDTFIGGYEQLKLYV